MRLSKLVLAGILLLVCGCESRLTLIPVDMNTSSIDSASGSQNDLSVVPAVDFERRNDAAAEKTTEDPVDQMLAHAVKEIMAK